MLPLDWNSRLLASSSIAGTTLFSKRSSCKLESADTVWACDSESIDISRASFNGALTFSDLGFDLDLWVAFWSVICGCYIASMAGVIILSLLLYLRSGLFNTICIPSIESFVPSLILSKALEKSEMPELTLDVSGKSIVLIVSSILLACSNIFNDFLAIELYVHLYQFLNI